MAERVIFSLEDQRKIFQEFLDRDSESDYLEKLVEDINKEIAARDTANDSSSQE